jgi:hypothetical protein
MPKRVIDADAVHNSDKVARCRPEHKAEYTWLYGLADANGNFEMTNVRSLHSKAYAPIRPEVSVDTVKAILADFERNGLLYTWFENGKKYGHWTGCEKPGRLPPIPHRKRYSGTLNVKSLYSKTKADDHEESIPNDPGLIDYLDRTSKPEPDAQSSLPGMIPEAEEVRHEAEKKVDEAAQRSFEAGEQFKIDTFRKFKELYPEANFVRETYTRTLLSAVQPTDIPDLFAGLEKYKASQGWRDGYIENSDRFLKERIWEKPPRETNNGKRAIGPASRTAEDHVERFKRNAKLAGLDNT